MSLVRHLPNSNTSSRIRELGGQPVVSFQAVFTTTHEGSVVVYPKTEIQVMNGMFEALLLR